MRLLGRDKLTYIKNRSKKIDKWLASWVSELTYAKWHCKNDVLLQFPTTQAINLSSFLFQVEQGKYEIEVFILFPQKTVLIRNLIELTKDSNE